MVWVTGLAPVCGLNLRGPLARPLVAKLSLQRWTSPSWLLRHCLIAAQTNTAKGEYALPSPLVHVPDVQRVLSKVA